jgi:hypothetical protein
MLTTGNQLRAARALAGLKQDELAKLAGLNTSTISERRPGFSPAAWTRSTGLSGPWKQSASRRQTSTGASALKCMQPANVVNEAARVLFSFGVTAAVVVTTVYVIRWLIG